MSTATKEPPRVSESEKPETLCVSDVPEYKALIDRRHQLHAERRECAERIEDLHDKLSMPREGHVKRPSPVTAAALQLLEGVDSDASRLAAEGSELAALRQKHVVLEEACRILDDQIVKEQREAERKVCEAWLPEHRALSKVIRDATSKLVEAMDAEEKFRDRLLREGESEFRGPLKPTFCRATIDRLRHWLGDYEKNGYGADKDA